MGKALSSTGAAGVETPFTPNDFAAIAAQITFDFWINVPSHAIGPIHHVFVVHYPTQSKYVRVFIGTYQGGIYWTPGISHSGIFGGATFQEGLNFDQWYHLCVASDSRTSGQGGDGSHLWVNSVLSSELAAGVSILPTWTGNSRISIFDSPSYLGQSPARCIVDGLRVWNKWLSQGEINYRYNSGLGRADVDQTSLLFGANLDEGSGSPVDIPGTHSASLPAGVSWVNGYINIYSKSFNRLRRR